MAIEVADDRDVIVTCPTTSLPSGETITCSGSAIMGVGSYVNIGTVVGNQLTPTGEPVIDFETGEPVEPVSASNSANVFGELADIEITKLPCFNGACGEGTTVSDSDEIEWVIEVTNIGNIGLEDIEVVDALVPACDRTIETLAVGESSSWSCFEVANVTRTNTVTATAMGVSIDAPSTVLVGGTATASVKSPLLPFLAFTGAESIGLVGMALVLVLLGGVLTLSTRREGDEDAPAA